MGKNAGKTRFQVGLITNMCNSVSENWINPITPIKVYKLKWLELLLGVC